MESVRRLFYSIDKEKGMDESKYLIHFQIIASAGEARSRALKALEQAETGAFEEATKLAAEARDLLCKAHSMELEMLKAEAQGESSEMNIISVHAQDHISMATVMVDNAEREIRLYKRINILERSMGLL